MTLKLGSVKIFNFRSVEDQTIELPEKGLVLLEGLSGHGKSTVPLAISYALGFCPYPMTDLLRWGTDNGGVEITFRGIDDRLLRSKKEVSFGSKLGSKEVESKLAATFLNVNAEILKALTYNQQDDDSDFLSLSSSSRYDALFSIFPDLAKLENIGIAAKEKRTELDTSLQGVVINATACRAALASDTLENDARDRAETLKTMIATKLEQKEKVAANLKPLEEKRLALEKDLQVKAELLKLVVEPKELLDAKATLLEYQKTKPVTPSLDDVTKRLASAQSELKVAELNRTKFHNSINDAVFKVTRDLTDVKAVAKSTYERALKRRPELVLEISRLESGKCYTCNQVWTNEPQLDVLRAEQESVLASIDGYEKLCLETDEKIRAYRENADTIRVFDEKQYDVQIDVAKNKVLSIQAEHDELAGLSVRPEVVAWEDKRKLLVAEIKALETSFRAYAYQCDRNFQQAQADLQAVGVDLQRHNDAISVLTREIGQEMAMLKRAISSIDEFIQKHKELKQKLADLEIRQAELNVAIQTEEAISKILSKNGFLGEYLLEILEEISVETNKFLARIKNTERITVEFTVEQKGTRQNIVVAGYIQGNRVDLRSGCSGGMYSSVRLAARLGIRSVLSRRTGLQLGWIILDESFNGLGSSDRESCLEILKEVAAKDLVIVIDHDTKFKSMFDLRIEAELNNSITTFSQRAANE